MTAYSTLIPPATKLQAASALLQQAAMSRTFAVQCEGASQLGESYAALGTRAKHTEEVLSDLLKTLEEALFKVVFVGRIKTGKSTIINYFVGRRLQPSSVEPQTAFPVAFVHAEMLRLLALDGAPSSVTLEQVQQLLRSANAAARGGNARAAYAEKRVTVEVPLEAMRGLPDHGGRLALIDAAGIGESGAHVLARASEWALERANFVIHVADYTKMNEAEDIAILQELLRKRPCLFRRGAVLVLLNKADEHKADERSVTPEAAPEWYRARLREAGVELAAGSVIAVRGLDGLRARLYLQGAASDEEKAELFKDAFGEDWRGQTDEALLAQARAVLERSGMPAAEGRVRALYEQHGPQLAAAATEELRDRLAALQTAAGQAAAALESAKGEADRRFAASEEILREAAGAEDAAKSGARVLDLEAAPLLAALWREEGPALARLEAAAAAALALLSGSEAERAAARRALGDPLWSPASTRRLPRRTGSAGARRRRARRRSGGGRRSGRRGARTWPPSWRRRRAAWPPASRRASPLAPPPSSGRSRRSPGASAPPRPRSPPPRGAHGGRAAYRAAARAGAEAAGRLLPAAAPGGDIVEWAWEEARAVEDVRMVPREYETTETVLEAVERTRIVEKIEPFAAKKMVPRMQQVPGRGDGGAAGRDVRAGGAESAIVGLQIEKAFLLDGEQGYEFHVEESQEEVESVEYQPVQKEEKYVERVPKEKTVKKVREEPERYERVVHDRKAAYSVDRAGLARAAEALAASARSAALRALEEAAAAPAVADGAASGAAARDAAALEAARAELAAAAAALEGAAGRSAASGILHCGRVQASADVMPASRNSPGAKIPEARAAGASRTGVVRESWNPPGGLEDCSPLSPDETTLKRLLRMANREEPDLEERVPVMERRSAGALLQVLSRLQGLAVASKNPRGPGSCAFSVSRRIERGLEAAVIKRHANVALVLPRPFASSPALRVDVDGTANIAELQLRSLKDDNIIRYGLFPGSASSVLLDQPPQPGQRVAVLHAPFSFPINKLARAVFTDSDGEVGSFNVVVVTAPTDRDYALLEIPEALQAVQHLLPLPQASFDMTSVKPAESFRGAEPAELTATAAHPQEASDEMQKPLEVLEVLRREDTDVGPSAVPVVREADGRFRLPDWKYSVFRLNRVATLGELETLERSSRLELALVTQRVPQYERTPQGGGHKSLRPGLDLCPLCGKEALESWLKDQKRVLPLAFAGSLTVPIAVDLVVARPAEGKLPDVNFGSLTLSFYEREKRSVVPLRAGQAEKPAPKPQEEAPSASLAKPASSSPPEHDVLPTKGPASPSPARDLALSSAEPVNLQAALGDLRVGKEDVLKLELVIFIDHENDQRAIAALLKAPSLLFYARILVFYHEDPPNEERFQRLARGEERPDVVPLRAPKRFRNAADFELAVRAASLHALLPASICFLIVSADQGVREIADALCRASLSSASSRLQRKVHCASTDPDGLWRTAFELLSETARGAVRAEALDALADRAAVQLRQFRPRTEFAARKFLWDAVLRPEEQLLFGADSEWQTLRTSIAGRGVVLQGASVAYVDSKSKSSVSPSPAHEDSSLRLRSSAPTSIQATSAIGHVSQAAGVTIKAATSAAQAAGRETRRRTPDADQLASALADAANEFIRVLDKTKRSLDESQFVVGVMGRFKAGKSTTLNAFLGQRLQPAATQPETAVPVEVVHTPGRTTPLLRIAGAGDQLGELVEGAESIRARLEAINDEARANHDTLALFDGRLTVEAPLELLTDLPSSETRFSFFDAAGKGEFGAEHLSAASDRILRIANYVIVVMEYTKMNEAEGTAALAQLKQQRPHLFETRPGDSPRVLVLLNKVDAYNPDEQRSVKPADAPAWVSAELGKAGVMIPPTCVLPFSALAALRARLHLLGRATDAEKAELFREAFGRSWKTQTVETLQAEAVAVLKESGLAAVEERLRALYVDTRRQLAASAAGEIRAGLAAISKLAEAELTGATKAVEEGATTAKEATAALASVDGLSREVIAGLELPELLEAGPFEAALSHRAAVVLAATAALVSGSAAARAAARKRLDWPGAIARFEDAVLEADEACCGEGTEAEAAARAVELWAAVERYFTDELGRLVPDVAGSKVAEALAGPAAEGLHRRLAAAAATVGEPAPALAALDAGPVLEALEAAAGELPPLQWGEAPEPAKRQWTDVKVEHREVLRPTIVEEVESYIEHEVRTRTVEKEVTKLHEVDAPVQVQRVKPETRKRRFLGIQIDKYTVHVPYTETEIRKEVRVLPVKEACSESYVEPVQKQRMVPKVEMVPTLENVPVEKQRVAYSVDRPALVSSGFGADRPADEAAAAVVRAAAAAVSSPAVVKAAQRALAEAARPALEALSKATAERAAAAQAVLAAARADEAEARRVLEELAAARAALDSLPSN
eukprot:tig00020510_g9940.t1